MSKEEQYRDINGYTMSDYRDMWSATRKELADLQEKYDKIVQHLAIISITHPHLAPEGFIVSVDYEQGGK